MRLLAVVRALTALGTALLGIVERGDGRPAVMYAVFHRFASRQLDAIAVRLRRGLEMAAALERRILRGAKRLDAERGIAVSESRVRRVSTGRAARSRPIGRMLEDICEELGVLPADAVWNELMHAVLGHGGNMTAIWRRSSDRAWAADAPSAAEVADLLDGGEAELPDNVRPAVALRSTSAVCWAETPAVGTGPPVVALAA